nr:hypothetical protein [Tanacetum cinerariifolium]
MDLFSLIRAPNPTKVKTGSRPRAPHELPLLTLTASRVIEMDEPNAATDSSGVPISTVPGGDQAAPVAVEPPTVQESRKRGRKGIDANAPPKSLRRDHADLHPSGSSRGGKSLAAMQLCLASNIFVYEGVPADVSDPDPLAFVDAPSPHHADVIRQYNINLARQVAMGSQLRLRLEQEAKLLRKSVAQVARREQRIQARESEIKNLEALLETEVDMKRVAKEKSAGPSQELERMRAQFSELQ